MDDKSRAQRADALRVTYTRPPDVTAAIPATAVTTAPWTFRSLAHALPDGLPTGALTVISMPNQSIRRGPWSTVVGQLLLDVVDQCLPAVYVEAGGLGYGWPEEGLNPLGPHYLAVRDDCGCCPADRVHSTARHTVRPQIGSTISTLENVAAALVEHERWHGPSLVVVDNAEDARPYADAVRGLQVSPRVADAAVRSEAAEQQAADLLAFAAARSEAPTVVVWKGLRGASGVSVALADAARLVITALPCERRRFVQLGVQSRRSLGQSLPSAASVVLPWFDWGFDDRELDEEDAVITPTEQSVERINLPVGPDPWAL